MGTTLVEVMKILGQRFVDAAALEEWQLENDIDEQDEEVEYLVQAKFSRDDRDERGVVTVCWMTANEMLGGDAAADTIKTAFTNYGKRVQKAVREAAAACN